MWSDDITFSSTMLDHEGIVATIEIRKNVVAIISNSATTVAVSDVFLYPRGMKVMYETYRAL
jgi:hypothetical protein